MRLGEMHLPEFDQEMGNTRKTLERIPEDKMDWKPHKKSLSLGALASHLSRIPTWTNMTIELNELDVSTIPSMDALKSRNDILKEFDKNLSAARKALSEVSDELLFKNWSLRHGNHTLLTMPKLAILRSFVMNHNIHHRAQLGVYLRLNDIPVPSIYGPSADEGVM